MNEQINQRIPEVGEYVRGVGTLVKTEEVPPPPQPPPEVDYIFEEITAHCELRLNGKKISEFESLWDAYGKESSVQSAIEAAKEYAKKNGIGAKSDLEVVAVKECDFARKRPNDKENFYDKNFKSFDSKERGARWDVPAKIITVVWSSKGATP